MSEVNMRFGEHAGDNLPQPLAGELGTKDNPFTVAPADFDDEGLPYAAWCRCAECGELGRSTVAFDFCAGGPGQPLRCETCSRSAWR